MLQVPTHKPAAQWYWSHMLDLRVQQSCTSDLRLYYSQNFHIRSQWSHSDHMRLYSSQNLHTRLWQPHVIDLRLHCYKNLPHHIAVISYNQPEIVLARELSQPSLELRWDHDMLQDYHEVTWNLYRAYQLTTEDINSWGPIRFTTI